MQKKTVIKLLAVLKANYRYTYRDMTKEELSLMVESWHSCLQDVSDEEGENAFHVALCKFNVPPTVADIRKITERLRSAQEPSDAELWSQLMRKVDSVKVLRVGYEGENFRDDVEKIYEALPDILKKFADFDTFVKYTSLSDTATQVERTRFFKAIPDLREMLHDCKIVQNKLLSEGRK